MRGLRWWGIVSLLLLIGSTAGAGVSVSAAGGFAISAFQAQWTAGEALAPNFWGPLDLAHDGQQEPYVEAPGGSRLVQYFDKARMELTNPNTGVVTNGLLANELITGDLQVGDNTFQQRQPAAIPIAGDPDNAGPTYAQLGTTASSLLAPATTKVGGFITTIVGLDGAVTDGGGYAGISMSPAISMYDATTQHNVLGLFADFRARVGLASVGLARSEPFRTTVKIAGTPQSIIAQVFERRVLTYNNNNPDPFKIEFGNIGQHYYAWRYPTGAPPTTPTTVGDPGQVALQALPPGYAIKTIQTVDLGGEGQPQAILIAENPAVHGQIAVLMALKSGAWSLAFRTKPDDYATATISAYPKTSAHPGFVTASYHRCGANCNDGEHTVIRWDGNGNTTLALNGPDDRGAFKADSASGRVSLTGPLYRAQDANCCASYTYARTWMWQSENLVPENLNVLPVGGTHAPPLPQWVQQAGPSLFTFLEPFFMNPPDTNLIGADFTDPTTVIDLNGNACMASRQAIGNALPGITIRSIGGLWPTDNGGDKFTLDLSISGGVAPMAQADTCTLGGNGVGGYVVTMQQGNAGFVLTSLQAVAQPFKVIPDTAIRVPPV
ncbi:MAG: hypothetical protein M3Y58_06500 [Chloroflexota bacterium]|nr:hypothetical protein [Chloroflexota bacterium]